MAVRLYGKAARRPPKRAAARRLDTHRLRLYAVGGLCLLAVAVLCWTLWPRTSPDLGRSGFPHAFLSEEGYARGLASGDMAREIKIIRADIDADPANDVPLHVEGEILWPAYVCQSPWCPSLPESGGHIFPWIDLARKRWDEAGRFDIDERYPNSGDVPVELRVGQISPFCPLCANRTSRQSGSKSTPRRYETTDGENQRRELARMQQAYLERTTQ